MESFRWAGILLLQLQGENFAHRLHLKVCHFQPVNCASKILYLQRYSTDFRNLCLSSKICGWVYELVSDISGMILAPDLDLLFLKWKNESCLPCHGGRTYRTRMLCNTETTRGQGEAIFNYPVHGRGPKITLISVRIWLTYNILTDKNRYYTRS